MNPAPVETAVCWVMARSACSLRSAGSVCDGSRPAPRSIAHRRPLNACRWAFDGIAAISSSSPITGVSSSDAKK